MSFPPATLALLEKTREVDVETASPKGSRHRVPIWIVVDGDDVFVRSYLGKRGRWYREIQERPAALVSGSKRIPVRAVPATDAQSKRRTSLGFKRKYPKSGSLDAMLRRSVLDTTLRLEPI
ncbi:MAG: DUF2255 family protein [Chloroflexi bacterium]|nr:MAG: DUF2255 family protein [Chloroflexota bacterium]